MLCACDSEEREHGVGAGVNTTVLSETPQAKSLGESATKAFRLRKKFRWIRKVFATFWPKHTIEKVYFRHKIQYWILVSLSLGILLFKRYKPWAGTEILTK
jgi:hypothetical protein